jgi:CO dehydrogenase nickel-insertion accessory protein CooC1
MAKIHMILQGKGGVGKSLIAALLAQYKKNAGQQPLCIDTDPVNATFHGFEKLQVKRLQIMENEEINPRNFDALVELIAQMLSALATYRLSHVKPLLILRSPL